MPLFQLCQNAGRRKPTQLKLSRNRHVRDYSREVGQHPVTARHANLTRTPISCSRQKDRMPTIRPSGFRDPWAFIRSNLESLLPDCPCPARDHILPACYRQVVKE